ncbi:tyrosine--tRNA ligase [Buchnera aphidicola]|uniref:Tyrosine--tRNA ligase n=1 Tax=Buchnera aphidicola (Cinara strobi) TaxID=1921549 RepID=A0A3B1E047_9GAMM|nr:tyrosine--tRNA ligase [Buchnera aphidicola]VAX76325.1 Tyrosine--tRNA ligase [Buchnera aphidicola (Cinara strobi)]
MVSDINILDFLDKKNFFSQVFDREDLYMSLKNKHISVYCGFDPTSNSLHVGHLLPILCLKYFQDFGHRPIILLGGATGIVGDPSFKMYERKKHTLDFLRFNQSCLEKQLLVFFKNNNSNKNRVIILNNYSWLKDLSILSFLRKVGIYFPVNQMIHKESVKKRLFEKKTGMSFSEFTYSLLQAYDFSILYKKYGVKLQIGGSDQWGNILSGIRLVRKLYNEKVFGATTHLLTKPNGEKFGKTENCTIWLDKSRTSPYTFYQFWINITDQEVNNYISLFTRMNTDMMHVQFNDIDDIKNCINKKIFLADFLTELVHGKKSLLSVKRIVYILFGGGSINNMKEDDFLQLLQDGIPFITCKFYFDLSNVLVKSSLSSSLTQSRNMIISGAIKINGIVQTKKNYNFISSDKLFNQYTLLCRGRKNYVLVKWEN